MYHTRLRLLAASFAAFSRAVHPAAAGPFDDGLAAYRKGDWDTAYKILQPLAETIVAIRRRAAAARPAHRARQGNGEGPRCRRPSGIKRPPIRATRRRGHLGWLYRLGAGVPRDAAQAAKWSIRPRPRAMRRAGRARLHGDGRLRPAGRSRRGGRLVQARRRAGRRRRSLASPPSAKRGGACRRTSCRPPNGTRWPASTTANTTTSCSPAPRRRSGPRGQDDPRPGRGGRQARPGLHAGREALAPQGDLCFDVKGLEWG